jgi:taurine dioxygenase
MTSLSIVPYDAPLGARIEGIDVHRPIDDGVFHQIEAALHNYGVVVFPQQYLDDASQKAFSLRFGSELDIHPLRDFAKPENPEVFILSNIVKDGRPIGAADAAQYWHTDLSYTPYPSRVSLLYAIEVPRDDTGRPLGDTEFAASYKAYQDLDETTKTRIQGLHAFHDARKDKKQSKTSHFSKPLSGDVQERLRQVRHPVVRTHPYVGTRCLYVNEGFTTEIDGLSPADSNELLETLFEHMTRREYVYAHKWDVGDLVVWDNCLTIHQGIPNYGPHQHRLMYRTIVKGTRPY